jgi:hypothetical protein
MLRFSPDKRITIKDAINHPYFSNFAHLGEPPVSETKFDWSWDSFELNKELLQRLIYMESLYFHPEESELNEQIPTGPSSKSSDQNVEEDLKGKITFGGIPHNSENQNNENKNIVK